MCRERTVALAQVAAAERAKVVYVCDFGDDWRHDVVVEKIVPAEPGVAYPGCTGGRRAAPREDCGGIWAFNEYQADWEDTFDAGEVTARLTGLAEVLIPASSLRSMTGHYFAKRYSGPPNFAGLPAGAGSELDEAVAHHGDARTGLAASLLVEMPSGEASTAGDGEILAATYFAEHAKSNLAVWPILPTICS